MCCQRIKRSTYLPTGVWILFQCNPSSPWFCCRCSLLMWHIVWTHGRNIKTYIGFRTLSAGDVNEDYVNSLDMVSLLRQPSTWSMVQMISYFLLWLTTQTKQWKSSAAKSISLLLTPSQHLLSLTFFTRSTCCFLLQLLHLNIMMDAFWEVNTCAE